MGCMGILTAATFQLGQTACASLAAWTSPQVNLQKLLAREKRLRLCAAIKVKLQSLILLKNPPTKRRNKKVYAGTFPVATMIIV